jgi:hypothetical protein
MVYAGFGIAGLAFGLSVAGLNFLPWTIVAALVIGGAAFIVAYLCTQRTPVPALDLTLFRLTTPGPRWSAASSSALASAHCRSCR